MRLTITIMALVLLAIPAAAQTLDGRPYSPEYDVNVDMYLNSYENAAPRVLHGGLEVYDILTRGSHLKPEKKGAVLEYANWVARASLPGGKTAGGTLAGEQYVLYVMSGEGTIAGARNKADLYTNMTVLVPEGVRFTMTAVGSEPLAMFVLSEPTYEGFTPAKDIVIKDENLIPISNTKGHWCHIMRSIFGKRDGLATAFNVLTVDIAPMTIPHPHSHGGAFEELWTVIDGESIAFLDKHLRVQTPGMGYLAPPDGDSPHSNINVSDRMVKMLYVLSRKDQ